MSAYAEAAKAVNGQHGGEEAAPAYGQCAAPGCFMPGTMTSSTAGTDRWLCRLHFGAPRGQHDDITAHANNRRELFKLALAFTRMGTGEHASSKDRDKVRALGRKDLVNGPDATAYALGLHMLQILSRECRAPQAHMGVPSKSTNWVDAAQIQESDA